MITVYLGDFTYRFNGTNGTLRDELTGITIQLSREDSALCNKSNANIDKKIQDYVEAVVAYDAWKYPGSTK